MKYAIYALLYSSAWAQQLLTPESSHRSLQNMCCMAMTASCLSCSANLSVDEYCAKNKGKNIQGCPDEVKASLPSAEIPKDCISWYDGCNNCKVVDGVILGCTKMFCPDTEKKEAKCTAYSKTDKEEVKPPKDCLIFFNGCNDCKVASDGNLHCPRRMCRTEGNLTPKCVTFRNEVPEHCTSWFDGCNTCSVGTDRNKLNCTEMACTTTKQPKCIMADSNCKTWYDGCNNCSVNDGKIGACTRRMCFTQGEPKCAEFKTGGIKPSKPTATPPEGCVGWFDGCNHCSAKDGKIGMCTMMFCENYQEPKCTEFKPPGFCKTWNDGCNDC